MGGECGLARASGCQQLQPGCVRGLAACGTAQSHCCPTLVLCCAVLCLLACLPGHLRLLKMPCQSRLYCAVRTAAGLATYGYKIMRVLGVKMTRLTNTRGKARRGCGAPGNMSQAACGGQRAAGSGRLAVSPQEAGRRQAGRQPAACCLPAGQCLPPSACRLLRGAGGRCGHHRRLPLRTPPLHHPLVSSRAKPVRDCWPRWLGADGGAPPLMLEHRAAWQ